MARLERFPASTLSKVAMWGYAVGFLLLGFALFAGGPQRWAEPSYTLFRHLPFAPYSYAVYLTIFSCVMAWGIAAKSFVIRNIGIYALIVYTLTFSSGLFITTQLLPTVAFSGPVVWAMIAFHMFVLTRAEDISTDDE